VGTAQNYRNPFGALAAAVIPFAKLSLAVRSLTGVMLFQ
jgi:hypothetical protein